MAKTKKPRKRLSFDVFRERFLEYLLNLREGGKSQPIIRRILRHELVKEICVRLMWHYVDGPRHAELSEHYAKLWPKQPHQRLLLKPRGRDRDWSAVEQAEKILGILLTCRLTHDTTAIIIEAADRAAGRTARNTVVEADHIKEGVKRYRRRLRKGAQKLIQEELRKGAQKSRKNPSK